ncbi:McrB family protein [Methanobrevibacter millerae]|uniref:Type II restriction endonuclease n=1 Tax=Methanobrevibacter millerae TaxID=230361 RepID=A0A0U3DRH3_9EURY|nr:AAA family ATPase [Methanobrevibacter millerae]ALT68985.1 type II restriction endonuclease [Methanobrevibacter millerae]
MNEQDFKNKFEPIKDTLEKQGIVVSADDYDGVVVKKLECNNTRGCGDQTHIEFSGEQMEMFPYLASYKYFNDFRNNVDFKSFYTFKMPICLNVLNLKYLLEKHETYSREYFDENKKRYLNESVSFLNEILQSGDFHDESKIDSFTTLLRGIKDEGHHLEISQVNSSDKKFEALRWLLPINSFIIILKLRKEVKYEIYGILPDDTDEISDLNLKFNYYHTARGIKTLVPLEKFEIPISEDNVDLDDFIFDRVSDGKNRLLYGVPGCGKSWTIKNKICMDVDEFFMERVVFHPDYTYSDFIGQILPKVSENDVNYVFTPGPFTNIVKKAYENPSDEFYLIIEEINRGNAPAIFGDIFQLLDRKKENSDGFKKGTSEFGITNSEIAKEVYDDENHKVRIPSNLSIIATMNTSDQNVFTLDTAFKRRWHMEMIENDFNKPEFKDTYVPNSKITWKVFGTAINEIILEDSSSTLSSEDKRLGAYFIDEEDLSSPKSFAEKVLMYLWDDVFKFSREDYFNKNTVDQFSLECFINKYVNNQNQDFNFEIFTYPVNNKIREVNAKEIEKNSSDGKENDSN